jgi:hypothetical protein
MNTITIGGLQFPDPRSFDTAYVALLYSELAQHSPERVCVGGIAWDSQGVYAHKVAGLRRLRCVYGEAIRSVWLATDLSLASLQAHLQAQAPAQRSLAGWGAPVGGMFLSDTVRVATRSLEGALEGQLRIYASLFHDSPTDEDEPVGERAAALSNARLTQLVREEMTRLRPALVARFGSKHRVAETAREFTLGFAGEHIVANFAHLWPHQLASAVKAAKSGLIDLLEARSLVERDLFEMPVTRFELIVHRPTDESIQVTPRGLQRVREALSELTDVATHQNLQCRAVEEPSEIARYIADIEQ